jgi:2-hydroxy-6-oxonona-2,4-dienedioate hydrolase
MGAGLPMVLVHGYLGGSSQWEAEIRFLSQHFDVIAVDLAGYGNAYHLQAPTEMAAHAQAVLSTLDQLGIDRFHLLGHSMGGMVAQEIVHLAPARVNKLVLYGTGPQGSIPGRFETMARSRERLAQDGLEATARRISAMWLLHREASPMAQALGDLAVQSSAQAAEAGLWAMERWDGRANLPNITQPTLIVWGDQDRSYQWPQIESLWRGIANSSLAVLPHCSHALHLEYPEAFHSLLLDFLLGPSNQPKSAEPAG